MDKNTLRYLGCAALGAAGTLTCLAGAKLVSDGVEELDDTLLDWTASKYDMYETSQESVLKTLGGLGLIGLGASAVGTSIGGAFCVGQQSVVDATPAFNVMIGAETLEDAQKQLDAMKVLTEK